mmetsp:Transcript_10317/g.40119  ORF Transcript_10317/g.40119 Transcript_10317/m.40119 type:complete len:276 (+) Transcript_10317:622-1449(+)
MSSVASIVALRQEVARATATAAARGPLTAASSLSGAGTPERGAAPGVDPAGAVMVSRRATRAGVGPISSTAVARDDGPRRTDDSGHARAEPWAGARAGPTADRPRAEMWWAAARAAVGVNATPPSSAVRPDSSSASSWTQAGRPSPKEGKAGRKPRTSLTRREETLRDSVKKLRAIGDMEPATSSKATGSGTGSPRRRHASAVTGPWGPGASSATLKMLRSPPKGLEGSAVGRIADASTAPATSEACTREKYWPRLAMIRALPSRTFASGPRPGP